MHRTELYTLNPSNSLHVVHWCLACRTAKNFWCLYLLDTNVLDGCFIQFIMLPDGLMRPETAGVSG